MAKTINGQGLPVLPIGQGPKKCPAPASCHFGTSPPLCPHACRSCQTTVNLAWSRIPVHRDRQDFMVAGDNPNLFYHPFRLHKSPVFRLDLPWGASHHHIVQRGSIHTELWTALCNQLNNMQPFATMAYHLQSNRFAEWFHSWLKDALQAWAAEDDCWDHLP
jgi:hypothetical protein